jgi:tetratricopeptide (TPR) repeat protein
MESEPVANLLLQVLGGIEERNKNPDKALEYYEKVSRTDPENALSFFSSGRIYQDKYLKAVERYRAIPEAERNAPVPRSQVKALLEQLTDAADATIDRWITFLKLTATNNTYGATRSQVEKSVAELYKYRHPDSPDGYLELIKP